MPMLSRLKTYLREIQGVRSQAGPYRFLVRRWDAISDIDLAANVLETAFFHDMLSPVPLPVETVKSVLLLAPHQDDEAIGAGGTLLLMDKAGVKLDVLYITDGAVKNHPYAGNSEQTTRVRNEEAREACSQFNAQMHHLNISNITMQVNQGHVDQLAELLVTLKPQIVMAPWILDLPPKHRVVNHLLWLAAQQHHLPDFEVWGYQVHNTLFPNGYVDITSVAEQKRQLIRGFRSEIEYIQCYDHLTMGMNAWNSRFLPSSPVPRYVEVFFTLPFKELSQLVEQFYFKDFNVTYRGLQPILTGLLPLHHSLIHQARA